MQILHLLVVQIMHLSEGKILHSGTLSELFSFTPAGENFTKARMQLLHIGHVEIVAFRPEGNYFTKA